MRPGVTVWRCCASGRDRGRCRARRLSGATTRVGRRRRNDIRHCRRRRLLQVALAGTVHRLRAIALGTTIHRLLRCLRFATEQVLQSLPTARAPTQRRRRRDVGHRTLGDVAVDRRRALQVCSFCFQIALGRAIDGHAPLASLALLLYSLPIERLRQWVIYRLLRLRL